MQRWRRWAFQSAKHSEHDLLVKRRACADAHPFLLPLCRRSCSSKQVRAPYAAFHDSVTRVRHVQERAKLGRKLHVATKECLEQCILAAASQRRRALAENLLL